MFPALDPQEGELNGLLEDARLGENSLLEVGGWAININFNTPPKAVFFTCTDAAGATRIVGQVGPNEERKDIADVRRSDALTYCGFKARIDLGKLPPGNYRVAAWGVGDVSDDVEETVVQLKGLFPVQIRPK